MDRQDKSIVNKYGRKWIIIMINTLMLQIKQLNNHKKIYHYMKQDLHTYNKYMINLQIFKKDT